MTQKANDLTSPLHKGLSFLRVTTVFEFDRGVFVEWEATKNPKPPKVPRDDTAYKVTITKPESLSDALSLLTLGIQAVGHGVEVSEIVETSSCNPKVVWSKNERAKKSEDETPIPSASALALERVGSVTKDPKKPEEIDPDEDGISLLRFKGTQCVLGVEPTSRQKVGVTRWFGVPGGRTGHGNMPPGGTTEK